MISPRGKHPIPLISHRSPKYRPPWLPKHPNTDHHGIPPIRPKFSSATAIGNQSPSTTTTASLRRNFLFLSAAALVLPRSIPALAASDEEYVKETEEVISKVRSTINLDKNDPAVATAVSELRDASNFWVAKYRREKNLLGRASFRDLYSALNAVSGHYISFGPTSPIPGKRKQRILEEMETAEKALLRGR